MTAVTVLDQIERTISGTIQVRLALLEVTGNTETAKAYHRTSVQGGVTITARIAAVNASLQAKGMAQLVSSECDRLAEFVAMAESSPALQGSYRRWRLSPSTVSDGSPEVYSNPFALWEKSGDPGYSDVSNRVAVNFTLNGAQRNGVFICIGQSSSGNFGVTPQTPHNGAVYTVNLYDGIVYTAKDPILGCSGTAGSYWCLIADALIDNSVLDVFVGCHVSVGGTLIAQWAPGGEFAHRIVVAERRLAALGIPTTAYIFAQGPQDAFAGTSQSAYAASLNSMIAASRSRGNTAPWFVGLHAKRSPDTPSASAAIRAAQLSAINNIDVFQWVDFDTLDFSPGVHHQADGNHLNDAGNAQVAVLAPPTMNGKMRF